jgi:hypothetical protein
MSDAIFEAKAAGLATKNDALRSALGRSGLRLFFLKRGQNTSVFAVVTEVTAGWDMKDDSYRGMRKLRIATIDESFSDLVAQTSHFASGVPVEGPSDVFKMEVFAIDPDRIDVTPPLGRGKNGSYWNIAGTKVANERFTIPDELL